MNVLVREQTYDPVGKIWVERPFDAVVLDEIYGLEGWILADWGRGDWVASFDHWILP